MSEDPFIKEVEAEKEELYKRLVEEGKTLGYYRRYSTIQGRGEGLYRAEEIYKALKKEGKL